jgi:hypothetical protein
MRLTNRGWFVLGISIGLGLWAIYEVSAHLWWVGHYCWGSMQECLVDGL